MDSHVAVLVLDTPIEGIADRFGDFGDNAKSLLHNSPIPLIKYQIAFDVASEDVAQRTEQLRELFEKLAGLVRAGTVKAVFLTGSRSDSFVLGNPWIDLLDQFVQTTLFATENFPIVGVCFGHQILAKNMGCRVARNLPEHGWEIGTTTIALNKSIFEFEDSPFKSALVTESGDVLQHINLVEFHLDVVYGMPAALKGTLLSKTSFQNLGATNKCSIQGLVTDAGPIKILTVQSHPEFSTEEALAMLEKKLENKFIDRAQFERLTYNTKNLANQGSVMGDAIAKFIEMYL